MAVDAYLGTYIVDRSCPPNRAQACVWTGKSGDLWQSSFPSFCLSILIDVCDRQVWTLQPASVLGQPYGVR